MKAKLTLSVVALLVLAGALGITLSASASGSGPHWTVEGVAQEGGGSETVSYSGNFGVEFAVPAGEGGQVYGCKKTGGSGKVLFTSPGTGEGHIELSECTVYSGHSSECKLAEPIVINMKMTLGSTEGIAYATFEPTNSGSAFTYFGVKNAVEKTCPSTITGEHVLVGDVGTMVGAEGVENALNPTSTGTTLKTALGERSAKFFSPLKQQFAGKDAGKKLGAK
jgi:hypothetical protein